MQPPHQHSRINLAELRAQIVKKLGPEGSKQYFHYLQRFLSLKLSKVEFNKLCFRILGRENIPLHNQLIRSILRNACSAEAPPPKDILGDGYQQNGSHVGTTQASGSPGLSNGGGMIPVSPRKARTGFRDRRSGDRRSALGPNVKASGAGDFNVILENGDLNEKMPLIMRSPDGSGGLVNSKEGRNDGKEDATRSSLQAPLGVPLCPVSIGGARRSQPQPSSSRYIGTYSDGALLDSVSLRERMEHIAVAQGLEGVSVDCANILNHGLDSYMNGLIRSCIELVGARSGHRFGKNDSSHNQNTHMKLINGVKPGHQYQMQNNESQEQKIDCPISLQDFRVAMELNPRQLGEDWPVLLEKICTQAFEE